MKQPRRSPTHHELILQVARRGYRIYEVPISYYGRTYDEGKKITWRDGFRAIAALVRFRFDHLDATARRKHPAHTDGGGARNDQPGRP